MRDFGVACSCEDWKEVCEVEMSHDDGISLWNTLRGSALGKRSVQRQHKQEKGMKRGPCVLAYLVTSIRQTAATTYGDAVTLVGDTAQIQMTRSLDRSLTGQAGTHRDGLQMCRNKWCVHRDTSQRPAQRAYVEGTQKSANFLSRV